MVRSPVALVTHRPHRQVHTRRRRIFSARSLRAAASPAAARDGVRDRHREAPCRTSCHIPHRSIGKRPRVLVHSAVDEAGAAFLEAGDCGSDHLVKKHGAWASLIVTAAAARLRGG